MTDSPCEKRIGPWQRIPGAVPTKDDPHPFMWRHVCECCEKQVTMTREISSDMLGRLDAELRTMGYDVEATRWGQPDTAEFTVWRICDFVNGNLRYMTNGDTHPLKTAMELQRLVNKLVGQLDGSIPVTRGARLESEVHDRPRRCADCDTYYDGDYDSKCPECGE